MLIVPHALHCVDSCKGHMVREYYRATGVFCPACGALVELLLRQDFDLRPDCDLDLGHRNLNHVRDTPSHYALSFCEVSSTVLQ